MKFLCLVYFEPKTLDGLSPAEREALTRDALAYKEALQRSGHLIGAQALEPVTAAATVRVRNGRTLTTDGPFAESKEVLAGFIFIEARDRDDALRVAERIPMAKLGSIEVRPVMDL